jgi:citrate synthase
MKQPLHNGLLSLKIPSESEVHQLTQELHHRSKFPGHVREFLNNLPTTTHPMTALISALQTESTFASQHQNGMNKNDYWKFTLEDSLDLIARLPDVALIIYRNRFDGGS